MTVDKITACHIRTKALNSLRVVDVIYLLTYAVLRSTGGGILRKTLFFRAPPPVDLRSYRLPDGSAAKEKKKKFGRLEHMIILYIKCSILEALVTKSHSLRFFRCYAILFGMVKKSKLLSALDAYKGKDYQHEKQKKTQKQAAKRKRKLNPPRQNSIIEVGDLGETGDDDVISQPAAESDGQEGDESEDATPVRKPHQRKWAPAIVNDIQKIDMSCIDDSDTESDGSLEDIEGNQQYSALSHYDSKGEECVGVVEDDGIPLSDIEGLSDEEVADIVPHQRLTINNKAALLKAHKSIALPISKLSFSDHQTIRSSEKFAIADVNDDLNCELAFYKQSLDAVNKAKVLLEKEGVPFSRPIDYFAEMVKNDEHMEKIKQKMTDEAANKKAAAEARKQRDLKKFGKQVQIAKLQERDKSKRATLDKINLLKRSARLSFNV